MSWTSELRESILLCAGQSPDEFMLVIEALSAFAERTMYDKFMGDENRLEELLQKPGLELDSILSEIEKKVESTGMVLTTWCFMSDDERGGARAFGDIPGDYQFPLPAIKTPRGSDEAVIVNVTSGPEKLSRKRQLLEAERGMKEMPIVSKNYPMLLRAIEFLSPTQLSLMIPFEERKKLQADRAGTLREALQILLDLRVISFEDLGDRQLVLAKIDGITKAIKGDFRSTNSNSLTGLDAALLDLKRINSLT